MTLKTIRFAHGLLFVALATASASPAAWAKHGSSPHSSSHRSTLDKDTDLDVADASAHPGTGFEERGQASWYGAQYGGKRTSDGSIFNPNAMTAAHASLPLGTRLRVTRQDNGKSVVVTVTDRQANQSRVIDLSRGAAQILGLVQSGTAQVVLVSVPASVPQTASLPDDETQMAAAHPRAKNPKARVLLASARSGCCKALPIGLSHRDARHVASHRKA